MNNVAASFSNEVNQGERFEFGKNWKNFITHLNAERIAQAETSLISFLGDLKNKKFVDVGSGSGLFSLAARNLGAKVFSLDYDPSSVFCTQKLKEKYYPTDPDWTVEQASVLDTDYINSLGKFDIVYSWGVLHHTGKMWEALTNAEKLVADGGLIMVAIYNTQTFYSKYWTAVKKLYNSNFLGKAIVLLTHIPILFLRTILVGIIKHGNPVGVFATYKKQRGMNVWHDWIDWLGGYPFETGTPEEMVDFYLGRGYILKKIKTTNALGCNEFVFRKKQ